MPTASDELRARMKERFGCPVGDAGPISYLEGQGYILNRDWTWAHPKVSSADDIPTAEWDCIVFLCDEWDFGGFRPIARADLSSLTGDA